MQARSPTRQAERIDRRPRTSPAYCAQPSEFVVLPSGEKVEVPPGTRSLNVYRLMIFDRPVAPWRGTRVSVREDALLTGNATADDYGSVYITVPAWIDTRVVEF